ncbi:unnamed protein product, partial [Discosporangium mesarthrocarpum]
GEGGQGWPQAEGGDTWVPRQNQDPTSRICVWEGEHRHRQHRALDHRPGTVTAALWVGGGAPPPPPAGDCHPGEQAAADVEVLRLPPVLFEGTFEADPSLCTGGRGQGRLDAQSPGRQGLGGEA